MKDGADEEEGVRGNLLAGGRGRLPERATARCRGGELSHVFDHVGEGCQAIKLEYMAKHRYYRAHAYR